MNDYNPLMKDFPIDELHAASSLEAIQSAVAAIYGHLRKIRTTSYPAQRAIYLVEAISRDLNTQLLKVHELVETDINMARAVINSGLSALNL